MANNTLRSLNLEGNGIEMKKSLDSLLEAVMSNNTLVELNLKSNRYIMPIIDSIESKLAANSDNNKVVSPGVESQPDTIIQRSPVATKLSPSFDRVIKLNSPDVEFEPMHSPIQPRIGLFNQSAKIAVNLNKNAEAQNIVNVQPAAVPQAVVQPVNLLNQPGQTLQDYLASFEGKKSLSEQMEKLNIAEVIVDQFEDPINLMTMNRPVKLNNRTYDYNSLLALKENDQGQRIVPETARAFYIIELAPDWDTKDAMIKVIDAAKADLSPKI
jgi:hypothetical protein